MLYGTSVVYNKKPIVYYALVFDKNVKYNVLYD